MTYDHYTGRGWSQTGSRQPAVAAEEDVFPGWTPDRPLVEEGFEPVTVTVQLLKPQGRDLYTPASRCGSSRRRSSPSRARGRSRRHRSAGSLDAGQMYDVTAVVSDVTEAQLASAPTDYEPQVAALYLDTTGITDRTGTSPATSWSRRRIPTTRPSHSPRSFAAMRSSTTPR